MKKTFYKIFALVMAFLLLVSTISWKVEKHYCMGRLVAVAVFTKADTCDASMAISKGFEIQKKTCCSNEVFVMQGQENLQLSYSDLSFEQQLFVTALHNSYTYLFTNEEQQFVPHAYYLPPILVKDIQVLEQVFLI